MSFLARVSYNYDSKYYITANLRADGSSKLAPGHRWGYFPSVSAAWRLSGEDFMEGVTWTDDLKVRLSWGQSGNQSGLGDYAWVKTYALEYYTWTDDDKANAVPAVGSITSIGYEDLTWETTTQTNLGIDWSMFGGRLSATFDAYYKYTDDMLMTIDMPGANPSITRNEAAMSNWGVEVALSSAIVFPSSASQSSES